MPRCIDADIVVKRLDEIQPFAGNKAANAAINLCKDIVRNAPAICPDELQGVVHCGECKFWRRPPSCEGLARCETGETGIRYRTKNDFCSRGEKREVTSDE